MSNTVFLTILICSILFNIYFISFGYFAYKKKDDRAKNVAYVFLVQGILILGIYIYLMIAALIDKGSSTGDATLPNGKSTASEGSKFSGLSGSLGNGLNGSYDYPDDPIAEAILVKGDGLLTQNNIQGAINEYKAGLKLESNKDIFETRISHAQNMKSEYILYQRGLAYFNKGDYENAYRTFKDIKPNELLFYSDIKTKMELIASGMLVTPQQGAANGQAPASQGTTPVQGNPPTAQGASPQPGGAGVSGQRP